MSQLNIFNTNKMRVMDNKIVVDSNCLQSDRLENYLRKNISNKVVLITAATVEAYKNNYEKGLPKSFEILGNYANQVLVAKNHQSVVSIHGRFAGMQRRLIDKTGTENFSKFIEGVRQLASVRKLGLAAQIRSEKSKEVSIYIDRIKNDVDKLKEAISIRADRYSREDISAYRRGDPPTSLFADQISEELDKTVAAIGNELKLKHNLPSAKGEIANQFVFRLALASHLLSIDWIANGGAKDVKPDKLVNDVMDMHFITYSTYFNGLMTNDEKPNRLHKKLRWWLENVYKCELVKPIRTV